MKLRTDSLKNTFGVAVATLVMAGSIVAVSAPAQASSTVTTTTATTSTPSSGGLIASGPSRHECVTPNVSGNGLAALQSAITKFDALTDTSVSCVSAYLNGAPTWNKWNIRGSLRPSTDIPRG